MSFFSSSTANETTTYSARNDFLCDINNKTEKREKKQNKGINQRVRPLSKHKNSLNDPCIRGAGMNALQFVLPSFVYVSRSFSTVDSLLWRNPHLPLVVSAREILALFLPFLTVLLYQATIYPFE
ncbi:hypothetical protein CEXT_527261 [Caerostris extrusa]|uniref:Uncharacterized protein n=1 Tax=Caerostris extrusa TaxID=172846 RepID=A0AAV4N4K4_CAEEX|nr:hypothetical protein CEXT_527261 [Caerostris extrusa]